MNAWKKGVSANRPAATGPNGGLRAAPNGRTPRRPSLESINRPAGLGRGGSLKGSKASRP